MEGNNVVTTVLHVLFYPINCANRRMVLISLKIVFISFVPLLIMSIKEDNILGIKNSILTLLENLEKVSAILILIVLILSMIRHKENIERLEKTLHDASRIMNKNWGTSKDHNLRAFTLFYIFTNLYYILKLFFTYVLSGHIFWTLIIQAVSKMMVTTVVFTIIFKTLPISTAFQIINQDIIHHSVESKELITYTIHGGQNKQSCITWMIIHQNLRVSAATFYGHFSIFLLSLIWIVSIQLIRCVFGMFLILREYNNTEEFKVIPIFIITCDIVFGYLGEFAIFLHSTSSIQDEVRNQKYLRIEIITYGSAQQICSPLVHLSAQYLRNDLENSSFSLESFCSVMNPTTDPLVLELSLRAVWTLPVQFHTAL